MNPYGLSEREEQVAGLLMEGKSNKQIALALGISERTVEFHLKNIYDKLGVDSRVEAILKLREGAGTRPGESTVEEEGNSDNTENNKSPIEAEKKDGSNVTRRISLKDIIYTAVTYRIPIFMWLLIFVILALALIPRTKPPWKFQREGEYPDEYSVGQVIQRSNASEQMVHGQFGTVPAWPPQPGFVRYDDIKTPQTDHLLLKLRYSKYSASSTKILVYLDDESEPRVAVLPVDQGNWDKFVWTDDIDLGSVKRGVHSIKFFTEGQEYGVADLDEFILTAGAP